MKYLTLITSIAIATVAAYFSIIGLSTIFAGSFIAVVVMASILEVGKLVSATWLHLHWKDIDKAIRAYLTTAVIVLMLITSMGIFGYLSKAHLEQTIQIGGTNELQIENLSRRLEREQAIIRDSEKVMAQLDQAVETLQEYDRIRGPDGAIAVRASQAEERNALNETITNAYNRIEILQADLLPLKKQQISLESEIGPLKYIAEMIYGDDYDINSAVRLVILLLVFVFDPLAIVLLITSTAEFKRDNMRKKRAKRRRPVVTKKEIMIMEE